MRKKIREFYANKAYRLLSDTYNTKSILDIYGKSRDEESHSSFIAWLLENTFGLSNQETPLMNFLNLLIERSEHTSPITIDINFANAIISRTLNLSDIRVKKEKKVKELSSISTEDEIDVFLECSISGLYDVHGQVINKLQIILENKVCSPEEGPKPLNKQKGEYDKKYQTERYYYGCACTNGNKGISDSKGLIQLFVFVAPKETECSSNQFIKISYQDLLDHVLTPLSEESLSDRVKIILDEYISALRIPSDDVKQTKRIVLAISSEEKDKLKKFCDDANNIELIKSILPAIIKIKGNFKNISAEEQMAYDFYIHNENLFSVASLSLPETNLSKCVADCYKYSKGVKKGFYPIRNGQVQDMKSFCIDFCNEFIKSNSSAIGSSMSTQEKITALNKLFSNEIRFSPLAGATLDSNPAVSCNLYSDIYIKSGIWSTTQNQAGYKLMRYLQEQNNASYFERTIIKV